MMLSTNCLMPGNNVNIWPVASLPLQFMELQQQIRYNWHFLNHKIIDKQSFESSPKFT